MPMSDRYWLVHSNGGRQLIDPGQFDLDRLAEQARRIGGRLVVEGGVSTRAEPAGIHVYQPPDSALGPLFRMRFERLYTCRDPFGLDMNPRPTVHVLGGYYHRSKLVRIYTHDRVLGRRPMEELFDTFLHELAHHLEYTEPESYQSAECGRVPGRMHSRLFWRILGDLKARWAESIQGR